MKAFTATALLATTGFAAKHSLMAYEKTNMDNYNLNVNDDATTYYSGFYMYSSSDFYISFTQPVDWNDDNTGITFEQLGLIEAASTFVFYWTPHSDYFTLTLGGTFYPFSFSFFDNVVEVTLGSLADLTSAEGFSVCDILSWSYEILKLDLGFDVGTYGWFDSLYDTFFNSDEAEATYVEDPSVSSVTGSDLGTVLSRSFISNSGWFGFNNCDDTEATFPWEMIQEDAEEASSDDATASDSTTKTTTL